jgi:uncharacterized protein (TIRG00374 family)
MARRGIRSTPLSSQDAPPETSRPGRDDVSLPHLSMRRGADATSPQPSVTAESSHAVQPMQAARTAGFLAVGVLVSAFFIYLVSRSISIERVGHSLASADYIWLVPTIVLTLVAGWVRAIRWRLLFSDPRTVTNAQAFGALSIGLMLNNLLPSRAGEVPRLFALRRATRLSGFEVGMTIVVERVLDVFVLALLGLALWPWLPDRPWIHVLGIVCATVAAACVALVLVLALFRSHLPRVLLWVLARLPFVSDRRARAVRESIAAGTRILLRPRPLLRAILLTLLVWALVGLSSWMLFPAFDLQVDLLAPWLVLVANSFAQTIPSGPGTVGVYEASVQAALVAFGVSGSVALSYALVLHAANFFPIILVGLLASWLMSKSGSQ